MRTLVLYAHPVPESFSSALHSTVTETLSARGWELDDCDLNAEGFQPVMSTQERRQYHDLTINKDPVRSYVERVEAAEALVLVFPVWNFGYPAILKGFFDRVFLPGVSFTIEDGKLGANLKNIRKFAAVTTYGGARSRAFLAGDPPRRCVTRHLRAVMPVTTKMRYLALYGMNTASQERRAGFISRVRGEMERF